MTKMIAFRTALAAVSVGLSGLLNAMFGGWSQPMTTLCIVMAIDYFSGLAVALVFHKSPKTEGGGASSAAGLKGLARKVGILALVAVAYQVDRSAGSNFVRDATAFFFIGNEGISILENASLMGIPIPAFLQKGLELIRKKAEEAEGTDQQTSGKKEN